MTKTAQDFGVYQGNSVVVTISVTDSAGAPVNLSGMSAIVWKAARSPSDTPVLAKSLGSGVALVGGGTGGQFTVTLSAADLANLHGFYHHEATVFDASGNPSTVSVGRMTVWPALNT